MLNPASHDEDPSGVEASNQNLFSLAKVESVPEKNWDRRDVSESMLLSVRASYVRAAKICAWHPAHKRLSFKSIHSTACDGAIAHM